MNWEDRMVEKPRTFTVQNNADGTITLIPAFGTVLQEGTAINAANMNSIETEISNHAALNATSSQRGHVKVDGITITAADDGTISGAKVLTGTYADTSTSIAASSTYTLTIPLGMSAKSGKVIFRGGNTSDYAEGGTIFFTTNSSDAICIGCRKYNSWEVCILSKSVDGTLYNSGPVYPIVGDSINITDAYISGTNLMIVFANADSSNAHTLVIQKLVWEAKL